MPTQSTLAMLTADADAAGARNIRVPVIGHFRILTDERVIGVVVDCAGETVPRADSTT